MQIDLEAPDEDIISEILMRFISRKRLHPPSTIFRSDIQAELVPYITYIGLRNRLKQAESQTVADEIEKLLFLVKHRIISLEFKLESMNDPGKP